jgi:hypothetical protein
LSHNGRNQSKWISRAACVGLKLCSRFCKLKRVLRIISYLSLAEYRLRVTLTVAVASMAPATPPDIRDTMGDLFLCDVFFPTISSFLITGRVSTPAYAEFD